MPSPNPLSQQRLESSLESWFVDQIRRAGGICIKLVPLHAGLPDRLVLLPGGRTFLVELKATNGTLSQIQRQWHAKAQAIGHPVATVYGREGVWDWLEDVLE